MSGAIEESSAEYELVQPPKSVRGKLPARCVNSPLPYKIGTPKPLPRHPPTHLPPSPHSLQSSQTSISSPSLPPHRLALPPRIPARPSRRRLNNSRQRNYTALDGREAESEYATPDNTVSSRQRISYVGYDRFFEGSEDEEEQKEGFEDSLISRKSGRFSLDSVHCCSKSWCCSRKTHFCLHLLWIVVFFLSLAALGIGVYNFIGGANKRSPQHTVCSSMRVVVAAVEPCHLEINDTTICRTEDIATNITVSASITCTLSLLRVRGGLTNHTHTRSCNNR